MKRNNSGDFCVLYIESKDDRDTLIQAITGQKKPIVIMLAEHSRLFSRPEDFVDIKRVRRQLDLSIVFIIPSSERQTQMAGRNGFPVYLSMDALADALAVGHLARQRTSTTNQSTTNGHKATAAQPISLNSNRPGVRKTVPLPPITDEEVEEIYMRQTVHMPSVQRPLPPVQTAHSSYFLPVVKPPLPPSNGHAPNERHNGNTYKGTSDGTNGRRATTYQQPIPEDRHAMGRDAVQQATVAQNKMPEATSPLPRPTPLVQRSARSYHPSEQEGRSRPVLHPDEQRGSSQYYRKSEHLQPPEPFILTAPQHRVSSPHKKRPAQSQAQRRRIPILVILVFFALLSAGLGSILLLNNRLPGMGATPVLAGRVSFLSSGQISENSSQGINDQIMIDLHDMKDPEPKMSYYGWLVGDRTQAETAILPLGQLLVKNGKTSKLYPGDQKHTNLLHKFSRFLITEESTTAVPATPSLDQRTWRYYGEFAQTPMKMPTGTPDKKSKEMIQHTTYLDHLRHLLATEPTLDQLELPGGLNTWFYRNVSKILEWSNSMREPWEQGKDIAYIRRQTTRILTYLDGTSFMKQDLPPGTPMLVSERLARVGLLDIKGADQTPSSYVTHVVHHLSGLLQVAGFPTSLRQEATDMMDALNFIKHSLSLVREDAIKIMKMNDDQLRQPETLTLLNAIITNSSNAYDGKIDPMTGQMQHGVTWLHDHMQNLALIDIAAYSAGDTPMNMA